MKNRWALRLAALTLVSCLAMSGVSLAVEPGSATDPLVTLSYLNDVFLGQIMTKVDQKITARNSQLLQQSGGAGGMSGVEFAVVTLSKGQVLTGDIGCEVMLRVGTASCVSPSNPGLIDETTAASLNNGGALAAAFSLCSQRFDAVICDGALVVTTYGYGDGLGLSQYGAYLLAKNGQTYKDILLHYYRGAEISAI